jgi:hypothetical protein
VIVSDPRCLDDAGHLLHVLSPAERQLYLRHLRGCLRCRQSLQLLGPVVRLLDLVVPDDVGRW